MAIAQRYHIGMEAAIPIMAFMSFYSLANTLKYLARSRIRKMRGCSSASYPHKFSPHSFGASGSIYSLRSKNESAIFSVPV